MITAETLQQFILRHKYDSRLLGSGASRVAYYCKKYNKVFKYEIGEYIVKPTQSQMEYDVFQRLPEKYKKFLPIDQMTIIKYKQRDVCVTVMPLLKVCSNDRDLVEKYHRTWSHDIIQLIADFYCLPNDMVSEFKQFIEDFRIRDLHLTNIGLNGRTLVLVDAGITDETS